MNHNRIGQRIMKAYDQFDPEEKLGAAVYEINFHLNDTYSPAPDVSIWRAGRIPPENGATPPKPDTAIEIQESDQSIQELTLKAMAYICGWHSASLGYPAQ